MVMWMIIWIGSNLHWVLLLICCVALGKSPRQPLQVCNMKLSSYPVKFCVILLLSFMLTFYIYISSIFSSFVGNNQHGKMILFMNLQLFVKSLRWQQSCGKWEGITLGIVWRAPPYSGPVLSLSMVSHSGESSVWALGSSCPRSTCNI